MKTATSLFFAIAAIFSCSSVLKSQDTLYMKSGVKIASMITEITPSLVRYKKADNPEGPTFVTNTTDVNIIKYRNGTIDTIKVAAADPVVKKDAASTGGISGTPVSAPAPAPAKIIDPHPAVYPAGMFYRYDGRRIKQREMHEVVSSVKDAEIDLHVKKAKTAKGLEYIGFVAIPALAFTVGYSLVAFVNNNLDGNPQQMSWAPAALGGVIAAGTLATSITFKIIGKNHNYAAVKLYNEKY